MQGDNPDLKMPKHVLTCFLLAALSSVLSRKGVDKEGDCSLLRHAVKDLGQLNKNTKVRDIQWCNQMTESYNLYNSTWIHAHRRLFPHTWCIMDLCTISYLIYRSHAR